MPLRDAHALRDGVRMPEVPFPDWLGAMRASWRQGEHVALLGPTGTGKTTLARKILVARRYVVAFAIKKHDDTVVRYRSPLVEDGRIVDPPWAIVRSWPPSYNKRRVVLWTKPKTLGSLGDQQRQIYGAMQAIYVSGGWCVFFDDASYLSETLRLGGAMSVLLNQGRASGISSMVAATRPRKVVREAFNQASIVIAFRFNDREDVKRVAEIAGVDAAEVITTMRQLGPHDFVAWRAGDGCIVRQ